MAFILRDLFCAPAHDYSIHRPICSPTSSLATRREHRICAKATSLNRAGSPVSSLLAWSSAIVAPIGREHDCAAPLTMIGRDRNSDRLRRSDHDMVAMSRPWSGHDYDVERRWHTMHSQLMCIPNYCAWTHVHAGYCHPVFDSFSHPNPFLPLQKVNYKFVNGYRRD